MRHEAIEVTVPGARHLPQPTHGDDWTVVIQPTHGWAALKLGVIWRYRELLFFLTWRDIKVRYKQTAFGAAWAILQPLLTMILFTLVFGRFAKIPSDGTPYPVFSYVGLVPWTFFAYALLQSSNSLVANSNLVSKIYFPRLIMPVAAALSGLVDMAIAFLLVIVLMVLFHVSPNIHILFLPVFIVLAAISAFGVGIWLSALNVQYRDVRYALPFIVQFWLFATPIAYPASMIHGKLHTVFALNPMAGVVTGFRWAIIGSGQLDILSIAVSTVVALLILFSGMFYFRRMEQQFADVV